MVNNITLKNGVRVVYEQVPSLRSCSLGIWVESGSRHEPEELSGISHFIEHMQFKGTQKRNAFEISDAFERLGAQVNAFTGQDLTCYYSKCTVDHTAACFELLACNSRCNNGWTVLIPYVVLNNKHRSYTTLLRTNILC